jgi:para-aminobenzoate synthetase/4-amino-4-deoxychorismate lyase
MLRLPLAIDATCGDVLRVLRDEPMPFALTGRWAGGGALVGASPVRVVRGEAAIAALDDARPGVAGGGGGLDEPPAFVGGGWFGYLGFGLGAAIERLPPAPPRPVPLEAAVLGFYDHMIRRDAAGRWWFEALRDDAAARARHAELERRLAGPAFRAPRPWRLEGMTLRGPGADGHRAAVAECVERIAAG